MQRPFTPPHSIMRRSVPVLIAFAVGVALYVRTNRPVANARETEATDARAVEQVLRDWYDAAERHDSAAWTSAMLPSFFIFEDTTQLDRATLTRLMFGHPSTGASHATLRDFQTQVSGDVAWTSFRNDEVFTPTGKPALPAFRFLETVVFRRVGAAWRMERYHATRINRPAARP